ncbi:NAD(P)/FAD-dependent oxidoreductase [Planktotalea sp.]|uniref:NAD(P)/FAD-dependent oxidoreductase n=1 Tax=Planktotalea sp. TaxID=2029877 RepID=UPI003D6AF685
MNDRSFEVAILGGGAAGSAAALALLKRGVSSVCIVEKSDFSSARAGETIPPDTNLLMRELGVFDTFAADGHLPCFGSHSLWGSPQLGHNDFMTSPYGHGWHIDRARFDKMLLEQAISNGAKLIAKNCTEVAQTDGCIDYLAVEGERIFANHFVDASGRNSQILRGLGVGQNFNDQQTVIWAHFAIQDGALGRSTWLEAASNGWWYAAGLPNEKAVVALGTDPRLAKAGGVFQLKHWAAALSGTTLIAPKLRHARLVPDSLRITASHSYRADRVCGKNWIAIGDAASGFDPLSSAGIYKALNSGKAAAEAIQGNGASLYELNAQQDYETYLLKRRELYQSETRWPESEFWAKRHRAA